MELTTESFYISDNRHQTYIIHRPTHIRRTIIKHHYFPMDCDELLQCKNEFITLCELALKNFPNWFRANKSICGVENTPEQLEYAIKMIDLLIPESESI